MIRNTLFALSVSILFVIPLFAAQTIAEKKASLSGGGLDLDPKTQAKLTAVNQDVTLLRDELHKLYHEAWTLHQQGAPEEEFRSLLVEINTLRSDLLTVQDAWRVSASSSDQGEKYALWQQPETTLEQLIIDYGSQDYVYLMSEEIAKIVLSVNSNLPIPRAVWGEMLEAILTQNGVGIRQVNPFLRELFFLSESNSPIKHITNDRKDLEFFPREMRVAFLLSPSPEDVRRIWFFLDKFINPNTTVLQLVGRDILIISQVGDILDLLKLHDFVVSNQSDKEYRLVALSRVPAMEMAQVLAAVFGDVIIGDAAKAPVIEGEEPPPPEANILQVVVLESLSQALFLVGTKAEVNRAERMMRDVESRIAGGREKTIYWYVAKHSTAEELADILEQIYSVMIRERVGAVGQSEDLEGDQQIQQVDANSAIDLTIEDRPVPLDYDRYRDTFYEKGNFVVNPAPVGLTPLNKEKKQAKKRANFIVDPKTGAIVMVVERDLLPQLQEVLRKIDVPKRMVQIDVLLFEKKISDRTDYGLNLLKLGDNASKTNLSSVCWNDTATSASNDGIFAFFLSRPGGTHAAAFDLIYKFLLTQQDIQINANPSVITINQTPAQVAIVEEFSINTGQFEVKTSDGVSLKDSFTRAQYGINLEITPTIHMRTGDDDLWDPDMPDYITLETYVSFDTVESSGVAQQPNVTRRNIKNEALIADGQTIILGGLRRKTTNDFKESIPFLGELPGLGKLFSTTTMQDSSTEMFIFLTPKILDDPCADIERLKHEEMHRRPGDIPDFLYCLNEARNFERDRLLMQSLQVAIGRPKDPPYRTHRPCIEGPWHSLGEYNGCR